MRRIEAGSYYNYLTEGCKLCRKGAKLVLFVTGECDKSCYYCPISDEKKGKDVIYANERPVKSVEDIVDEAISMSAEGVAITGGEPLLKLERVLEFLEIFSEAGLHTHLYTSVPAKESVLKKLSEAGLDEIRFHPPNLVNVEKYREPLRTSTRLGIEAGFEIPAIKFSEDVVKIVNEEDAFLNVNELEFSATNYLELERRGWEVGDFYEAKGSREVAERYSKVVRKFHFCSVRFKDVAQFRRRLIRMAFNMPEFYKVTNEGTVICGYLEGDAEKIRKILTSKGVEFFETGEGFEVDLEFAEKNVSELKREGIRVYLVERYPTHNRTLVSKTSLG